MTGQDPGAPYTLADLFLPAGDWTHVRHPIRLEEFAWDDAWYVRAELPGVDVDRDVEITVEDRQLHINVERRPEREYEDQSGYRSEFAYGRFVRSWPLPPGASVGDIEATYEDGILQVKIPYQHDRDVHRVPIRAREEP